MKIVSFINFKGGVGKTTLAANVGAELASRGYRVLLIDLDPQASLTFSFVTTDFWSDYLASAMTIKRWFDPITEGVDDTVSITQLISKPDKVKDAIDTNSGYVHIIPSHLGLINTDLALTAGLSGGEFAQVRLNFMKAHRRLADGLADRSLRRSYDIVLVDCAPYFNLLNKAAVVASDHIVIPARPDYLSTLGIDYLVGQLKRLVESYENFRKIRPDGAPQFPRIRPTVLGVVFTMVQFRAGEPIQALKTFITEVQKLDGVQVFSSMLRLNAGLFASAPRDGVPVSVRNSVPPLIAQELDDLATELVSRADLTKGKG